MNEIELRMKELQARTDRIDNDINQIKIQIQHLYEQVWSLQSKQKTKLEE